VGGVLSRYGFALTVALRINALRALPVDRNLV